MLPLILGIIFTVWAVADGISYVATGEDTIYNLAVLMGWTGTIEADNVIIEWGMSGLEFLFDFWIFIAMFLGVVCLTFWFSTRPLKPKGSKVGKS